jgi:hypothetical protein
MARKRKLSTHGIATAQAIGNREEFTTHGALSAVAYGDGESPSMWDAGRLEGVELDYFRHGVTMGTIEYVVYSYATPIAWVDGGVVHRVSQRFSVTTSKHQGQLYLLKSD